MARDISKRLSTLKARRSGTDRLGRVQAADRATLLEKSILQESYQKRAPQKPYTSYALGAMQEVGSEYTRVSVETAKRVENQLLAALQSAGRNVEFRLQGSVPANIHIRGVSDVDLLTLDALFCTYDPSGAKASFGGYLPSGQTSTTVLSTLRQLVEVTLKDKFPATSVDVSGGKAVNISGGSLARPVDVVPSHWYDTRDYQRTSLVVDRAVTILDKKTATTIDNMPFRHIDRINKRDTETSLSLKKAIRLCKNVKSDAQDEGKTIGLPSFDIAAMMFHADTTALGLGGIYELAILSETQRHLDALTMNEDDAKKLLVPDGSRYIFNTAEKLRGLRVLSLEIDDLLSEVAKEQKPNLTSDGLASTSRALLSNTFIPFV